VDPDDGVNPNPTGQGGDGVDGSKDQGGRDSANDIHFNDAVAEESHPLNNYASSEELQSVDLSENLTGWIKVMFGKAQKYWVSPYFIRATASSDSCNFKKNDFIEALDTISRSPVSTTPLKDYLFLCLHSTDLDKQGL
jgi:hypothetical protein